MKYRRIAFFFSLVFSFHVTTKPASADPVKFCAPVAASGAMILLEYVAYVHPVLAIVGSTIGLAEIARYAYKAYKKRLRENREQQNSAEVEKSEDLATEVFLAERYYYEQRKQQLTKLRDEFAAVYRGIIDLKELFHPQVSTFSSQFLQNILKHHTPVTFLNVSVTDELKLSDERKRALRKAREQEFELLEKEIAELHTALVVHFNELMRHVNEAHDAYYEALPTINHAINVWNANLNSTTDSIASATYEQNIREECLLSTIKQAVTELKVIFAYYQRNKQRACLQQSTDILDQLDWLRQAIIETEQWTSQELARVAANQRNDEHYFARRGIPTAGFKNQVKNTFYKDQANKNNQALKKAKETQTDMCTAGGPDDPKKPKDDDDKDDEKVKTADMSENEGILRHIFRNEEGHLPRTPENYKLIRDLVREAKNYLGPDIRGNHWWGKILENGKQLWAQAYKGIVRNGGMNDVPRPYNAKTGLSKLI